MEPGKGAQGRGAFLHRGLIPSHLLLGLLPVSFGHTRGVTGKAKELCDVQQNLGCSQSLQSLVENHRVRLHEKPSVASYIHLSTVHCHYVLHKYVVCFFFFSVSSLPRKIAENHLSAHSAQDLRNLNNEACSSGLRLRIWPRTSGSFAFWVLHASPCLAMPRCRGNVSSPWASL